MEKRKKSKELSEDLRTKNVPVSTVRNVIKKFTAHGTVANLPGCGRKRKIYEIAMKDCLNGG